jgi:hypothetical protein
MSNTQYLDLFKNDNAAFVREVGGPNTTKMAEAAGLFIAEKLRERSFARQILTPRTVTRYDLKNSVQHDQLVFIDEKEVHVGKAKPINFRADPDATYLDTPRYEIPIQEMGSDLHSKREIELLASTQPVVKVVEENIVREIEEAEDGIFLKYVEAAATSSGNTETVAGTGKKLTKNAVKRLINKIESKRLKCSTILMPVTTFNDILEFDYQDLGSDLLKEVTIDGYKYYNWAGRKLIVSLKTDLLTDGSGNPMIYGFADEKALGRFLVLESTKFGVRKVFQTIEFAAWEYIGMAIANNNAVARVSLAT